MAKLIEMPKLSPTMEEGQIATWHAKEGDVVDVDDLLAEVETDKATMEFRSFDKGVLLKILADEGAVVNLGDPVAIIGNEGEDIAALVEQAGSSSATAPQPEPKTAPASPPEPEGASAAAAPAPTPAGTAPPSPSASVDATGRVKASPYVRKLARERGIDLHRVGGTGPGGRIIARDLESLPTPTAVGPAASVPANLEPEVKPLSMMRKTIARRLTESKQTVPHFYLTIDVDADPLWNLRKQINADLADVPNPDGSERPVKVSLNDLVIKAVAVAITHAPAVNAQFTDKALVYHRRIDISVAVAVEDGLVTPVIRQADRLSVMEISRQMRDLATRARDKKLAPEEMLNGTFSISNLGMYGIDEFSAVINPPEGAILAVGGVREVPVVKQGAVVPGRKLNMTLSCDHRVVDGAVGATFLAALRKVIERPTQTLVL
ncbi:MAG: pyruvate dehydrogenase complex dihydrolipoamide acetyltransferase [Myxococcota bacterium]